MSEEPKEEMVFIAKRVADNPDPLPGSTIADRRCNQCGAEVWVSPASRPILEKVDRVLCERCAPPEALDINRAEHPSPDQQVEIVEALLPRAVKELVALAGAYPWVPERPPDARHYRDLAPGISVCFTLDMQPSFCAEHLSVSFVGREPSAEIVSRITRAFFGKALPAPAVSESPLGPLGSMHQDGQMVSVAHRYAWATVLHFHKIARRAG